MSKQPVLLIAIMFPGIWFNTLQPTNPKASKTIPKCTTVCKQKQVKDAPAKVKPVKSGYQPEHDGSIYMFMNPFIQF